MAARKLIVTALSELARGESDSGRPWVLYDVAATTPAGEPIGAPLRTFDRLPVGEVLELDVEPRQGRRGTTYTLKRRRRRGGPSQRDLDELRGRLEQVEGRVDQLEHQARQPHLFAASG